MALPVTLLLLAGFVLAEELTQWAEGDAYQDTVLHAESTPYQRIVLTRNNRELRLFLNGNLQFSSADEYRYHEALVHPGVAGLQRCRNVLVLGGGDGMAVRELLKWPQIQSIRLVDLDPAMTRLFRDNTLLAGLNGNSLRSPKLRIQNADAFRWVRQDTGTYDFIVIDFPDPGNYSVGKLYTETFYREVQRLLQPDGALVVQSTSPYIARRSFWCVEHTLRSAGLATVPYHCYVPSFGEWGYVLAMKRPAWRPADQFPRGLRFLDAQSLRQMLVFPPDMASMPTEVNRLNNQVLVHYFEADWGPYMH